jgi:N-acyl amino acid synthase of PEP-CTERM/exosortase system
MASKNFEVILADDQWSRQIHYQLRYQVYCLETGYEDPAHFPDGQEKDEWDDDSIHFLVRERGSGQWVAAMRLVLPSAQILPIKQRVAIEPSLLRDRRHSAEVSRLCMVGHYRRRLQDHIMTSGNRFPDNNSAKVGVQSGTIKQQRTSEILKVLLKAAVAVSCERAIAYCYMLTTRALAKIAGHVLPMEMQLAGPSCSHRGERYPYLVNVDQVMTGLMEELSHGTPAYRLYSNVAVAMPHVVGGE